MDAEIGVVGAGVIGAAVALELARRGASVTVLEAEPEPGLAASGTNSGIVHTGFDSTPGELETRLILRSAELRDPVLDALGIPVLHCGAVLRASDDEERATAARLAAGAGHNGVSVELSDDGSLLVPGESVTDPVVYTRALAGAAEGLGAELRTDWRLAAVSRAPGGLDLERAGGGRLRVRALVNCAGLRADEVARMAGDDSFEIYPRKGEFLVFDPPDGRPIDRILLPVPTARTKGVLVFPTLDGKVVAGPTAVDLEDKDDWSVRPEAAAEILPKAVRMHPPLEDAEPIAAYAGLRPAGRGVNYVIGHSAACPGLGERGRRSLHRADRLTGGGRARGRARGRAGAGAGRPGRARAAAGQPTGSLVAPDRRVQGGGMSRPLLLGIDEGTSAVKAVLYDTDLQPQAEARREKPLAHPRAGWVEQDPQDVMVAVVDAVGELLAAADGEVVACGLDHQGESVLAWNAESGDPLTPIVTWQDKRSQEVLDRLEASGADAEVRERSGMPLDPYFSAGKLTWLLEHEPAVQSCARGGHPAPRHRRLVAVRHARLGLRHGPLHRVAHPALGAGRPGLGSAAARSVRGAARLAAGDPGQRGRPRRAPPSGLARPSCRCARRWWTSRRRWPARAARSRDGSRPPTAPACSYSRTRERNAPIPRRVDCCRPSRGAWTGRWSTRSTGACSPPARCSNG